MKFETPAHKKRNTATGYELKVFESDPYYHVEVYKSGEFVRDHILTNDKEEFDTLVKKYELAK